LPGRLTNFDAIWSAAPNYKGDAVLGFTRGRGRLSAQQGAPVFHPLIARRVEGVLSRGRLTVRGALALAGSPAQDLAGFTINHNFNSGVGQARAKASDLDFTSKLQPYDVSELARGVVDNVRGPVDVDLYAHWTARDTTTGARASLKSISFATAALGPIEGVTGAVEIDDLGQMTTPPGQRLHIASMNPGITVENGEIVFQLKGRQRVAIERASWPFANGQLAIEPTILTLGGDETRLSLALSHIDVDALTKALNVKELTATGTVGGRFPLIFSRTKGRIENGRLEAGPDGGVIAYRGDVGAKSGPARLAFDALRAFNYDALSIDLNGDLDGELVSAIHFSGRNREPVDAGAGPIPMRMVGIPFKFTVTIAAPFGALARSAAGIGEPTRYLLDIQAEEAKTPATK
jgi:hypothetical protein